MDSEKRNTLGQFVAFNLIGLANTLLGLLIYLWLTYIGVYYVAALVTIYILGIGFSFIMNKTYTFQINKTSGYSMIYKMICIYGLMFFLNIICLQKPVACSSPVSLFSYSFFSSIFLVPFWTNNNRM